MLREILKKYRIELGLIEKDGDLYFAFLVEKKDPLENLYDIEKETEDQKAS